MKSYLIEIQKDNFIINKSILYIEIRKETVKNIKINKKM